MSLPSGTHFPIQVISTIKPVNGAPIPVVSDVDVEGGYQVRTTLVDRNNIPSNNRKEGMLVFVQSDTNFYTLSGGITNSNWIIKDFSGNTILPLTTVMYVDVSSTVSSPNGSISSPFILIQDAVDALPNTDGYFHTTGGTIYLAPGDYSAQTVNIVGKLVEFRGMAAVPLLFNEGGASPDGLPDIISDSTMTITNIGTSTGNINCGNALSLDRVNIQGNIQALGLVANAPSANITFYSLGLNSTSIQTVGQVTITGYLVQAPVTGGDGLFQDATFTADISLSGSLFARNCVFSGNITSTASIAGSGNSFNFMNCIFAGQTISFSAGTPIDLIVDSASYKSILATGVTVTNANIRVLLAAGDEQTFTGLGGGSVTLTVLAAGHTPGLYLISGIAVVNDPGSGRSIVREVDWSTPNLGADLVATSSVSITTTGSLFTTPVTIRSDGTQDIQVTFSMSGAGDAPDLDVYAGATLQVSLPLANP